VDARGENLIAVAAGANGQVTPTQVRAALTRIAVSSADVVLVSNEIPIASVRAALVAGREAGATTMLNPAPATGLDGTILPAVDLLVPNTGELAALAARAESAATHDRGSAADADPAARARFLLAAPGRGV